MWIRSQDKKTLVKADKLIIGYDKDEKVYEIHNVYDSLGIYKSKERAIEVLNEIQAYLENNYLSINDMPQHNNGIIANGIVLFPNNTQKVYQMPEA